MTSTDWYVLAGLILSAWSLAAIAWNFISLLRGLRNTITDLRRDNKQMFEIINSQKVYIAKQDRERLLLDGSGPGSPAAVLRAGNREGRHHLPDAGETEVIRFFNGTDQLIDVGPVMHVLDRDGNLEQSYLVTDETDAGMDDRGAGQGYDEPVSGGAGETEG